MILGCLLIVERMSFVAFNRGFAVTITQSQIKYVLFYFLQHFLQIRGFVFNYCLVLFYLWDQLRVLLEFLSKSNSLFEVQQPLLGSFFILAGIELFVRLFNDEVKHVFFHIERHFIFLYHLHPIQTAQRSDLFWFLGVVSETFIPDQRTLERVDLHVPFLQTHERTFCFENHPSYDCRQRNRQISLHVLLVSFFFIFKFFK